MRRAALLAAAIASGACVGAAGHALTGATAWYLAVPAAVAVVWLVVADLRRCAPPVDPGR